jgi:uncharacterized protein (DUF433 family)
MNTTVLGQGIYSISEASRLINATPQRVTAWFRGGSSKRGPVFKSSYSDFGSLGNAISFLDLIEALMALRLREKGVSLIVIRKARQELAGMFKTSHPLAHKDLSTDGTRVFVRVAEDSEDEQVIDVIKRQHVFPEVLKPYLSQIEFSEMTRLAERWHITQGIILDPTRCYGQPIVDDSGVPTAVLASAYWANQQDAELVADWFGVAPQQVEIAVQFEGNLRRSAA